MSRPLLKCLTFLNALKEKPFLKLGGICVKEDLGGPTCAMPLKQVSWEGESRSESDLQLKSRSDLTCTWHHLHRLNMNKLLLLGAALVALSGRKNFIMSP